MVRIEKDTIVEGQACRKYLNYEQLVEEERNILRGFGFTFEQNDSIFF